MPRIWLFARLFMASVTTSVILAALLTGFTTRADSSKTVDQARIEQIERDLVKFDQKEGNLEAALSAHLSLAAEQRTQLERRQAIVETQIDNIMWLLRGTALGVVGLIVEVVMRMRSSFIGKPRES